MGALGIGRRDDTPMAHTTNKTDDMSHLLVFVSPPILVTSGICCCTGCLFWDV